MLERKEGGRLERKSEGRNLHNPSPGRGREFSIYLREEASSTEVGIGDQCTTRRQSLPGEKREAVEGLLWIFFTGQ